jgi:hypothetical protein
LAKLEIEIDYFNQGRPAETEAGEKTTNKSSNNDKKRKSIAQKQLEKASAGTRSITAFFGKKTK